MYPYYRIKYFRTDDFIDFTLSNDDTDVEIKYKKNDIDYTVYLITICLRTLHRKNLFLNADGIDLFSGYRNNGRCLISTYLYLSQYHIDLGVGFLHVYRDNHEDSLD